MHMCTNVWPIYYSKNDVIQCYDGQNAVEISGVLEREREERTFDRAGLVMMHTSNTY